MSKIAIVYWSGTGNTEAMAEAVAAGVQAKGVEAALLNFDAFAASMVDDYDAIAFGCPSMGDEELESGEFAPLFESCEPRLKGKKIALFGSYGWGDGAWMRSWEETCRKDGAVLAADPVICNGYPNADAVEACKSLGAALA